MILYKSDDEVSSLSCHQTSHLPLVGCVITLGDAANRRSVICELQDEAVLEC